MMLRSLVIGLLICSHTLKAQNDLQFTVNQAEHLVQLPLKCLQQEYPNKLGQVLNNAQELRSPSSLHPIFYGCFDWHSSVHGHWLLVALMKRFPDLPSSQAIREKLNEQFTVEKVAEEMRFFETKYNENFERTYGWAWLLKLQLELDSWKDKDAQNWAMILRPYSELIVQKYKSYLPKLVYPIRTGEHINTAFGLTFAHDYAVAVKDSSFLELINKRAKDFYLKDKNYPLHIEPSGYDFLSPALEEADLMRRVLTPTEIKKWIKDFLPQLSKKNFYLEPGKVSDRTDGKLVHLDGLNFSRAWCLYGIAAVDPKRYGHLKVIAEQHIRHSLPSVVDGDYMGEHWLASFAVYALMGGVELTNWF
jgi:hypothetical protein